MAKYIIESSYYDGKDVYNDVIGLIEEKDLDAFIEYLRKGGYVGKMENDIGGFGVRIDCGWLDHHGDHYKAISIRPYEELKTMLEKDWRKEIEPYEEPEFTKVEEGYYKLAGAYDYDDED